MKELDASIENAGDPTQQAEHNTPLVQPDEKLEYVLRPDSKIYANMLNSTRANNFDPPILYIDQPFSKLPDKLQLYISTLLD